MLTKLGPLVLFLFASILPLRADITYNLTLTPDNNVPAGSGTLTINLPLPASGDAQYVTDAFAAGYPNADLPYRLDSLVLHFDGYTFTLDGKTRSADAIFGDGQFVGLDTSLYSGNAGILFGNDAFGGLAPPPVFEFFTNNPFAMESGEISGVPAPTTPTPEPSTLALLGTGLLGLFLTRRALT